MIEQILGWVATTIFTITMLPQIIKTIKNKSVENVSILMFIIFLIGNIVALTYATLIDQQPLQIKYILAIVSTVFYIIIYYRTKNKSNQDVINVK